MGNEKEENMNTKCGSNNCEKCSRCYISMEESNHSRRCFMTGEYCSQQRNIQHQREKLHKDNKIMAFVVMNFSDMSEVVYKWRICSFVESLSKYLFINNKTKRLCCSVSEKDKFLEENDWENVKSIQVVRADSDPSSNYVICNRICQQMQMADLVVVDVSNQNPNVFYEFGMAVALGKLILPICYSESYYKMLVPDGLKNHPDYKNCMEHHIGCYPWQKSLFEYYGIRYKHSDNAEENLSKTKYESYDKAVKPEYGFKDIQYSRFPYHEKINEEEIGRTIYRKLEETYNNATSANNTLVVYTMEKFLGEDQAGRCIVNFYHDITSRMRQEQCFCGERVGVLVQENSIPESDKDAKKQLNLFYDVGEIIHIGLNQATYQATERKIKTKDVLDISGVTGANNEIPEGRQIERYKENIIRCVKAYIRNRGLLIYPNNPVYVNRVRNKFYKHFLQKDDGNQTGNSECYREKSFCLYYVMLETLCYTNEIVVDISNNYNNCLQALFWLGAAHGSDIYAITVLHEETDKERELVLGTADRKTRNIFDVAGLWTAILHSNDTEGFYKQLALAQQGVENHSKLIIPDREFYEKRVRECMALSSGEEFEKEIGDLYRNKMNEEKQALESYYRNRFWKTMLRYNQLHIYLPQQDGKDNYDEPKAYTVRWDIDAVSELSHYLSKRKPIGEYRIVALENKNEEDRTEEDRTNEREAKERNFISVGEAAKPLNVGMAEYINGKIQTQNYGDNVIHTHRKEDVKMSCDNGEYRQYKGFACVIDKTKGFFSQHPLIRCINCKKAAGGEELIFDAISEINDSVCILKPHGEHTEIAQLILWREDSEKIDKRSIFRVSLIGSSGPATLGAAMLFVDEEQKERYLKTRAKKEKEEREEQEEFLSELQEIVRGKFMEVFMKRLTDRLHRVELTGAGLKSDRNGSNKECYFYLVKCAVQAYLSTVLYRYFLPFLSERDIERIHNGMQSFLDHMKAAGESPFALDYKDMEETGETVASNQDIEKIVKLIPEELLLTLQSFKGLEVFYEVTVRHGENGNLKKDTRHVNNPASVSPLSGGRKPQIRY